MEFEPIVNKVTNSELMTLDLEKFWEDEQVASLDLAPYLFKGLILKEKDFRQAVKDLDASEYAGKHVAVFCSTKAIIPTWAYMLVAVKLSPTAASVGFGTEEDVVRTYISDRLKKHDWSIYEGRNVIVKGCPSDIIPTASYLQVVTALQKVAAKIMYGEACSSVPVWRRPADGNTAGKEVKPAKPARLSGPVSKDLPRTS